MPQNWEIKKRLGRLMDRSEKLLKQYEDLGPNGMFGASKIRIDLGRAARARDAGNRREMKEACETLRDHE
jgi:hypothetical protein